MNNINQQANAAARRLAAKKIAQGFEFEALHSYTDHRGNPLYWRIRLKNTLTGEKAIWPLHKDDSGRYILKEPTFLEKKPLYNLYNLTQKASSEVWIVEGELCADKLNEMGLIATTSGASSSAIMADWSILKNRKVIIWPDNDEAGLKYAKQIAQYLQRIGCSIKQVDIEQLNLAAKADCIDWLKIHPNATASNIEGLPLISIKQEAHLALYQRNNVKKSASLLLELIQNMELFHDESQQAYASFYNKNGIETRAIYSEPFKGWLSRQLWEKHKRPVSETTLQEVLSILCGKALYEGKRETVFTRIGYHNNNIYINLSNDKKQIIEISVNGWKILNTSPIKFKSTQSMRPLPTPQVSVNTDLLWNHINIAEPDRKLVLAWILDCWIPPTNFPILVLTGPHGSAKSTTQDILRRLIDPNSCNLRTAPKQSDDISIAAANNWLVSYNNISKLSQQNQDDLCCLSTGGGFAKRRLFTDSEETVFNIKRPVILNSINNPVTAQDLISRSIIIELPTINATARKSELELKNIFNKDHPFILGALLELMVKTLKVLPSIHLTKKPRMADFALLGSAIEQVMQWPTGSFMQAYSSNYQDSMIASVESSAIALALSKFLDETQEFIGTFGELLEVLSDPNYKPENTSGWPTSPKGLANILKYEFFALDLIGIKINFTNNRSKLGYIVEIKKT